MKIAALILCPDGVLYPLEGGLLHVRRMLAAISMPASPLAALPSEARYLDCPACGERRQHDVRWWSCSCGNERALDSVATVTGGAS